MTITDILAGLNSPFAEASENAVVVLAAGHGKRIKSEQSKMLHQIWGVSTVERVHAAAERGLNNANIVIVVGVKAEDVAVAVGKRERTQFVYQAEQRGTGDAVRVALAAVTAKHAKHCYVLPGDMGLVYPAALSDFSASFKASKNDMMVLTGIFEGPVHENYYGRIVRAKQTTADGKASAHAGKVIEIKEYKDIMALTGDYRVTLAGETFSYTKDELLAIREFNAGVYAFSMEHLQSHIVELKSNNVQHELYITDLIAIFNQHGLTVGAVSPKENTVVLGFNNKSVLKMMDNIARERVYEKIKDIVTIDDEEDFFIADEVIAQILALDTKGEPLDIVIGKGVHLGKRVKINYGMHLQKNVFVDGAVVFGRGVTVWANVHLSCYDNQTMNIGDKVEILWGNIIKGNIAIKDGARIESSVNITGSDEHPVSVGRGVIIKGTSYIFGSVIEDGVSIEHSILIRKFVRATKDVNGGIQKIRFVLPQPEGLDSIVDVDAVVKKNW
ncbi:MAG: NTP transferase domain-containing protein [Spirochaetes bacterium]|nr:NTP transferase domain-containing protein [Spirochaetota bacterium]